MSHSSKAWSLTNATWATHAGKYATNQIKAADASDKKPKSNDRSRVYCCVAYIVCNVVLGGNQALAVEFLSRLRQSVRSRFSKFSYHRQRCTKQ